MLCEHISNHHDCVGSGKPMQLILILSDFAFLLSSLSDTTITNFAEITANFVLKVMQVSYA